MPRSAVFGALVLSACMAVPSGGVVPGATGDLAPVAALLPGYAQRQLRELALPGMAIAVAAGAPDGRVQVWQQAFGRAGPASDAAPLAADAVFRVASISKLVTATAVMVLVEQARLELDAPVTRYLPEFRPANPFGGEVTLRHLLGHRAGLVRESPVGHYFDPSEPGLAATVRSLNDTALVHAPGSAFKYSNPGFAVLGAVVERVTGRPFADAAHELVLAPLGLRDSDFRPRPELLARAATGAMWTYDGRAIPTPTFGFGFGPAADLRSTVGDLVQFAQSWWDGAPRGVLSPDAQAAMWTLEAGAAGCGLGFFVDELDGRRCVGHDGAAYGFASALRALPSERIAVAVVVTKDFANATAEAIAARALRLVQAARAGRTLPEPVFPQPVGRELARRYAGHWRAGRDWVELYERDGELIYDPNIGVRTRLRLAADGAFISDDPLSLGDRRLVRTEAGGLHDGQENYVRDDALPALPPAELLPLLGEYGWDHNTLVVYEDRGELGVLIEWVARDLPQRLGAEEYVFQPGLYGGDRLRFERDAGGAVVAVRVGGARFARRPDPVPGSFRIPLQRPIPVLLAAAATASPPPAEPTPRAADLVELAPLSPTLRIDLRYATADNFLGAAVYPVGARALLQRPAAAALVAAHGELAAHGLGLWVFDAYRPWSVTKVFWDATPEALREFVADPAQGSRHNRGCAVDVTLYELASGRPVVMPSDFDEFTPRAYPEYPGGTTRQRWYRELLRTTLERHGFTVNPGEWWHFDFQDWREYPIGNAPL
jgi:CubicO group peptidase (beta-lactamase class C family)/D-alanyl-D-alanine dipeptidase